MKVYEAAKLTGKTNKEVMDETGCKSHMSKIPDNMVSSYQKSDTEMKAAAFLERNMKIEEAEAKRKEEEQKAKEEKRKEILKDQTAEESKPVAKIEEVEEVEEVVVTGDCPVDLHTLELGCRIGGNKYKYWNYRNLIGIK